MRAWERRVLLVTLSGLWIHHVDAMDELREAAMLQAFGQQDPLVAYKRQGYEAYEQFRQIFQKNVVYQIYHILWQPTASLILHENDPVPEEAPAPAPVPQGRSAGAAAAVAAQPEVEKTARKAAQHPQEARSRDKVSLGGSTKIGRNEPCYCGSGKKYKHCHGRS